MADFWLNLIGNKEVTSKDQLKLVVNKRVAKTMQDFSGSKEEIKKVIVDMVNKVWVDFDDDNSGDLDKDEFFNFLNVIIKKKSGG